MNRIVFINALWIVLLAALVCAWGVDRSRLLATIERHRAELSAVRKKAAEKQAESEKQRSVERQKAERLEGKLGPLDRQNLLRWKERTRGEQYEIWESKQKFGEY